MNSSVPFFSDHRPYQEVLPWLQQRLSRVGLRIMQTFDLNAARVDPGACPCPHHGTSQCDCQMVVLLVYGDAAEPVTVILHGNDGQTWLSFVNTPLQRLDAKLQSMIERALQSNLPG